jgi:hypothetical protein
MGHLQQFEAELRTRIEAIQPGGEPDELIHWLKEQVLASYRNGDQRAPRQRKAARA